MFGITLLICVVLHNCNTIIRAHVVDAWMIDVLPTKQSSIHYQLSKIQQPLTSQQQSNHHQSITTLWMAGFGDSSSASSSSSNIEVKLKPKQQWDRYVALKKEKSIKVGVKIILPSNSNDDSTDDVTTTSSSSNNWLEVGAVKCDPSIAIDVAVARQRALIVEVKIIMNIYYFCCNGLTRTYTDKYISKIFYFRHCRLIFGLYEKHAKRLYPLKVSPKAQIEWGYRISTDTDSDDENDEASKNTDSNWITVDKNVLDSIPIKGMEKLMGFEGTPDPTTGFYCVRFC
jgi:hypothetical protein